VYHAEVAQADLHVFPAQRKIGEYCSQRQDRMMIQLIKARRTMIKSIKAIRLNARIAHLLSGNELLDYKKLATAFLMNFGSMSAASSIIS